MVSEQAPDVGPDEGDDHPRMCNGTPEGVQRDLAGLLADAETTDEVLVPLNVLLLDVVQHAAALPDHD